MAIRTERVVTWARADWSKASETGDLPEMARLERLGKTIKDHRDSAINLAAWALQAQSSVA